MRRKLILAVAIIAMAVVAVAGSTLAAMRPHEQAGLAPYCFAEWCVEPVSATTSAQGTVVQVKVSSTARAAAQRPDHPQAWITDSRGHAAGGPQPQLDRQIGPQASYVERLDFALPMTDCVDFVVAEGAWPRFLGLGYAPSPFTARAHWRLCP